MHHVRKCVLAIDTFSIIRLLEFIDRPNGCWLLAVALSLPSHCHILTRIAPNKQKMAHVSEIAAIQISFHILSRLETISKPTDGGWASQIPPATLNKRTQNSW